MKPIPKVSVIIPVYNVEDYIERCARSLFEQTLDDIEYIFIDDCTPDKSIEILKEVLEEYPHRQSQVIIHQMVQNSGQARVREWGCKHARGEYVIHCDTDDWVDTNIYKTLYLEAKDKNLDLVMCNYYVTDGISYKKNEELHNISYLDKETLVRGILTDKYHRATWNKLIRRSIYNMLKNYPSDNMWEDVAMISQLVIMCNKVGYVNECLYNYYLNPASISSIKTPKAQREKLSQVRRNVDVILNFYKENNLEKKYAIELLILRYGVLTYAKSLTRKEYVNVYPSDNLRFLFCNKISLKSRLGHLLRLSGVRYLLK